eukprot:gene3895-biopygen3329
MPPKPKSALEKLKQERRQIRRTFTKIFNEASALFTQESLRDEEISLLKSSLELLTNTFQDSQNLEKEIKEIVLEEIEDETEQDDFFDEGDSVIIANKGKLSKLEFIISKFDKPATPSPSSQQRQSSPHNQTFTRSKLPDLNLPAFDGNITEWFGFWERIQSQVGKSPDLPKSAKFTYLVGQLRGEALATVKGLVPSDHSYDILEMTLQENFGLPRRIIRAHVMHLLRLPKATLVATNLRQFYNSLMGDIRSLNALGINVAACAPIIIPIIEDKLPVKR